MAGKSRTGTVVLTSNSGSHGGGGASRGGNVNIDYNRALENQQAQAIAAAVANQQSQNIQGAANQNAALSGVSLGATPTFNTAPTTNNLSSGGGATSTYQATPTQTDPYASIYSLYDQMKNAENDAYAQQRAARLNALQANYNNAKRQLDSSFNSGETELNQNADRDLREAYINNMLNQKNMAQYLAGQGITGGAAESIIANLYNTYGNNRNTIETNRANGLRDLLANYQGTLGDIENAYLSGMADADADYSGNIANALTSYYSNLADLQKQNIANQYKAALGKSGSSKSADTSSGLDANTLKTLKSYKSYDSAKRYLDYVGVPEALQEAYFYESGQGDLLPVNSGINKKALTTVPTEVRNRILSYLDQERGQVYGSDMSKLLAAMQTLGQQYGLSEEQVRALLAEAGY